MTRYGVIYIRENQVTINPSTAYPLGTEILGALVRSEYNCSDIALRKNCRYRSRTEQADIWFLRIEVGDETCFLNGYLRPAGIRT